MNSVCKNVKCIFAHKKNIFLLKTFVRDLSACQQRRLKKSFAIKTVDVEII
jgi:hypothetical protein